MKNLIIGIVAGIGLAVAAPAAAGVADHADAKPRHHKKHHRDSVWVPNCGPGDSVWVPAHRKGKHRR